MRPSWNPTRRNRNIGTAKQGHGKDNRLVIPNAWEDLRPFWARIGPHVIVHRTLHGHPLPIVVEYTRDECVHACTVDDIETMLHALPLDDVCDHESGARLAGVILRQPTRKQEVLRPAWGRLGFGLDLGPIVGAVIVLDATVVPLTVRWGRKLAPHDREELERLEIDAREHRFDGRYHVLDFGLEEVRRVQLFRRTLAHEIGHFVQYRNVVTRPRYSNTESALATLVKRYSGIPDREREAFANRYAREVIDALRARDVVPFDRIYSIGSIKSDGLRRQDFEPLL